MRLAEQMNLFCPAVAMVEVLGSKDCHSSQARGQDSLGQTLLLGSPLLVGQKETRNYTKGIKNMDHRQDRISCVYFSNALLKL